MKPGLIMKRGVLLISLLILAVSSASESAGATDSQGSQVGHSPVILEVPYYKSPSGRLPWCTPAALAMLMSYYGERTQPADIAEALGTPRTKPQGALDVVGWFEWQRHLGSQLLGVISELLHDLLGLGNYTPVSFAPRDIIRWVDQNHPVYVAGGTIDHDFLIVGYEETGDPDKPLLYIHDPTGYLAETLLGHAGSVAERVPFVEVKAQLDRFQPMARTDAFVFDKGVPHPRAVSLYISEDAEFEPHEGGGATDYHGSISFRCCEKSFRPNSDAISVGFSICCKPPQAYLYFDRGLRWKFTNTIPPVDYPDGYQVTGNRNLTLSCVPDDPQPDVKYGWIGQFYAVVANSSNQEMPVDVALVIQTSDGEVLFNESLASVVVQPYSREFAFLGNVSQEQLAKRMEPGVQYWVFLVVRNASTGEKIDWEGVSLTVP